MRFALAMGPLVAGVATQFERQLTLGVQDGIRCEDHITFVTDFLDMPGGRTWRQHYRNRYHAAFRNAVDGALRRFEAEE